MIKGQKERRPMNNDKSFPKSSGDVIDSFKENGPDPTYDEL